MLVQLFPKNVDSTFYEKYWFNILFQKCCNIFKNVKNII
jgi:hypothetical protein